MNRDQWAELERVDAGGAPTLAADPGLMSLWFSTKGRISRSTYWLKFVLPMALIQIGGAVLDVGFGLAGPETMGPVTVMTSLLVVWPGIVNTVGNTIGEIPSIDPILSVKKQKSAEQLASQVNVTVSPFAR